MTNIQNTKNNIIYDSFPSPRPQTISYDFLVARDEHLSCKGQLIDLISSASTSHSSPLPHIKLTPLIDLHKKMNILLTALASIFVAASEERVAFAGFLSSSTLYNKQIYRRRQTAKNPITFKLSTLSATRTDLRSAEREDGWDSDILPTSEAFDKLTSEALSLQEERKSNIQEKKRVEKEKDLFIPMFALVSIAGFFGLYTYEMLRLYSRGELYLPWNQ